MLRKISKVMSGHPVTSLAPSASVLEAAQVMEDKNVGSVLVMEDKEIAGIFTEQDAVRRVMAAGRDPASTRLEDVMTRDPDVVSGDQFVIEALRLMEAGDYRHIPVMGEDSQVLGVFSRSDFCGEEEVQIEGERHLWETV